MGERNLLAKKNQYFLWESTGLEPEILLDWLQVPSQESRQ
jgi:hypothetical protein